jgi:hypothetical protein
MPARLTTLFGCCLWGAISGWAVALAVVGPALSSQAGPGPALMVYGALACFGGGYLLGSTARGRPAPVWGLRAAALAGALAFVTKALAPALAAWTALLLAAAVFGVLAGLARSG